MDPLYVFSGALTLFSAALTFFALGNGRVVRRITLEIREDNKRSEERLNKLIGEVHLATQRLIQEEMRAARGLIESLHRDTLAVLERTEKRAEERHQEVLQHLKE